MDAAFWWQATYNSLVIAIGCALIATLIALPVGWLLERCELPARRFFSVLYAFPYVTPPYLLAMAWIILGNPRVGWLNEVFKSFTGHTLVDLYGLDGILLIESTSYFPIVLLSFRAQLRKMDSSFEEAARLCGASRWTIFRSIHLPLLKKGILASMIAVALTSLASFGVPAMMGAPERVYVLTTGIYALVRQGSGEAMAEALRVSLQLASGAFLLVLLAQALGRGPKGWSGAKSVRPSRIQLGRARTPIVIALALAWGLLMGLPLLTLFVSSFRNEAGALSWSGWGFSKWIYVFTELPDFRRAAFNSVFAAGLAGLIATLGGLGLALLARGTRPSQRTLTQVLQGFFSLIFSVPGTVVALLLVSIWSSMPAFSLANTLGALVVAYVLKYFFLSYKALEGSASLLHPALIEAARLAGASKPRILRTIIVPLLKPALWAAFLVVWMPCLSELSMSILLQGPGTETLGTLLFQLQEYADRGSGAVVGTVLLAAVALTQSAVERMTHES
jgi:iron(III) transport system permease protein